MSKPTLRIVPQDGVGSDAELACEIAKDYGYPADPWQFALIDDLLQERENGLYAAPVAGFSVARRNGKSHVVVILTLYFMLVQNAEVVYSAHHSQSANEMWKVVRNLFEETELSSHVKQIVNREGRESIYLNDGGSFRIFSRAEGKGAGRGSKADVVILDEALDLTTSSQESLLPMTANARNPLTLYLGSPAYATKANGAAFRKLRTAALRGDNPRAFWVEWSAPEGANVFDPAVWRMCNPAMAAGRITEDFLSGQLFSGMSRAAFLIEHLGSWVAESRPTIVDKDQWDALTDHKSALEPSRGIVWALDAANDSSIATIVAVGYNGKGKRHVETVAHLSGASWTYQKVLDNTRSGTVTKVVIDEKGALAHFAEAWLKEGVPLVVTNTDFMANSAVSFVQSVADTSFVHLGDNDLWRSIRDAVTRPLAGRYAFTKADPESDITGLVAMALGLYALGSDKAEPKLKKPRSNGIWIGDKYYPSNR